jgi:hypothetical protein
MSIRVVAQGLIYRNPKPHLRAAHAWHPTLAIVSPDAREIVASFDIGQAAESLDYRPHLSRSLDGGATWSAPRPFVPEHPRQRASSLARIGRVGDGSLVALGAYLIREDPERGIVNHETFGYVPTELFTKRSTDGGRTWSPPQPLMPPIVGPSWELCHAIIELRDGRWLAPMATWKAWDGSAPGGMKAVALVSTDRGKTWPRAIDVMDDYANGVIHFEQSIRELSDGRLLAVAWAYDERTGKSGPTPYAISRDGRCFSKPQLTGLRGQTAKILALPGDRILCLYRRDDRPGLWANLSRIDGDRWVNLGDEAPIWQGAASGMSGERRPGDELSDLKFGFPNMLLLPSGEVLAAFWCNEQCQNVIRWVRLAF